MASWNGECSGLLALGASDNLSHYILPGIVQRFSVAHPKATLKIFTGTSAHIQSQIKDGKLEMGVFYTPLRDKSLKSERIGFVEFVIVQKPGSRSDGFVGCWSDDYIGPYVTLKMLDSVGIQLRHLD